MILVEVGWELGTGLQCTALPQCSLWQTPQYTLPAPTAVDTVVYVLVGCGDPPHSHGAGVEMKRQSPSECHKLRWPHREFRPDVCGG
jgi:hypothetical protein